MKDVMQTLVLLVAFGFLTQTTYSQVILLGLDLSPKGKIEFSTGEPNYNGNLDDTAYVKCGQETRMEDWRNVKFEFLTIVEAPDERWTFPSNLTPSNHYDTNYVEPVITYGDYTIPWLWELATYKIVSDSVIANESGKKEIKRPEFEDIAEGLELTDDRILVVRRKIEDYVKAHAGKSTPSEPYQELYDELSGIDSLTENGPSFDYLVDRAIFYNYNGNQLTSVIGYHWDYGLEFDTMRYDKKGNMIYFSHEDVGAIRYEYYFEYNKHNSVSQITYEYSSSGQEDGRPLIKDWTEVTKYGYNKRGEVISKSWPQPDGTWAGCYFGHDKKAITQKSKIKTQKLSD